MDMRIIKAPINKADPAKIASDLEFDSMINVRPWQGNRSRGVENETTQALIRSVVERLVSEV